MRSEAVVDAVTIGGKADMLFCTAYVRFWPKADLRCALHHQQECIKPHLVIDRVIGHAVTQGECARDRGEILSKNTCPSVALALPANGSHDPRFQARLRVLQTLRRKRLFAI